MEHWSDYNYCIDFSKDSILLYNSFSNGFVELPTSINTSIDKFKNDKDSSVFDTKTRLLLNKVGAIFEGNSDKQLNALKMRHGQLTFGKPKYVSFTILPTMQCNFRCSYCFESENNAIQDKSMSEEVQDALVEQIISFSQKGYKIELSWFGGEPLMEIGIIESISNRLKSKNVEFSADMTTNGFLLTPEVVDKMEKCKIKKFQITIDGDEYTHNSRRMLTNGAGTYHVIMDNLKYLSTKKGMTSVIRVNVDKTNESVYSQIATTIQNEFPGMYTYPGFVVEGCNACSGKAFSNHMEKADFYLYQYKEYQNPSLPYFPSFTLGICMASNLNSWVVGPDGELYNCLSEVGVPSKVVGNVKDNTITNMDHITQFMVGVSPFENAQCKQCHALPICGGGCALDRIAKKNGQAIDTCTIFKNKGKLAELLKIHYEIKKQKQEITTL